MVGVLILAVVGALVLAVAVGLGLTLWETWWLFPLWSMVMVPLGLPVISFWHLFALNLFVSVMFFRPAAQDYAKEADGATRTASRYVSITIAFLRPAMAYYVIRWAL